jgi:hypothetical protein
MEPVPPSSTETAQPDNQPTSTSTSVQPTIKQEVPSTRRATRFNTSSEAPSGLFQCKTYVKKWKADTNWSEYEMHFAKIAHGNNIVVCDSNAMTIQTSTNGNKFKT